MESNYAFYCLHKFRWTPSQFTNLDEQEKAFVIAAIQIKVDQDIEEEKKMKAKSKKR